MTVSLIYHTNSFLEVFQYVKEWKRSFTNERAHFSQHIYINVIKYNKWIFCSEVLVAYQASTKQLTELSYTYISSVKD